MTLPCDGVTRVVDGSTDITVARSAALRIVVRSKVPVSILQQIVSLKVANIMLTQDVKEGMVNISLKA